MKGVSKKFQWILAAALVAVPALASAKAKLPETVGQLQDRVRHELVMLPYYDLFDNFAFRVNGNNVTLYGQVVWPTLKSEAENVVKQIPGVGTVTNEIEVLPLSPMDNQIRFATARAIYGEPALSRYAYGPLSPIHIIVRNGNVTLEGVVANATDRNTAALRANGVFGVFSVTNNLRVENL